MQALTKNDVAAVLADLRQINSKVLKIAGDFSEITAQAKQAVAVNKDRVDEIVDNMTQVSQDLKATSKEVRRNPWRLMHTPDQKEELHAEHLRRGPRLRRGRRPARPGTRQAKRHLQGQPAGPARR